MGEQTKQPLTPAPLTPAVPVQSKVATMSFPEAMKMVIDGKRVKRLSWSPSPDYGFLKDGWLTIFTKGKLHTWKVNDGDMEASDWVVAEVN